MTSVVVIGVVNWGYFGVVTLWLITLWKFSRSKCVVCSKYLNCPISDLIHDNTSVNVYVSLKKNDFFKGQGSILLGASKLISSSR